MIDQFVPGLPQPTPIAKPTSHERQQSGPEGQDSGEGSFGEMVAKASQQQQGRGERNAPRGADQTEQSQTSAMPEQSSRPVYDLSSAIRKLAGSPDGRLKLAGLKDAMAAADMSLKSGETDDERLSRLMEKFRTAAKINTAADELAKAPANDELSPADELGLLLGLAGAREADGKGDRKATANRKDSDDKKSDAADDVRSNATKHEARTAENLLAPEPLPRERAEADPAEAGESKGTVRVVSADGRGRNVDISLARVTSEQARDTEKTNAMPKIETATVLEARRYLGFSPDTNATTLANAAKADPGWSAALAAADRVDLGTLGNTVTEVNTLKLQMNPENLGNMVALLRLKGEELTVELQVSSVEAYRHLTADQDDIIKALQDQGFSIDKVTVQLNAAERTDAGNDRDMSRQGQTQRDAEGGQPRGEDRRGTGRDDPMARRQGRDDGHDDSSAGMRTSGGVYL